MYKNKILFFIVILFLISSCAGTWDSVKRGVTGAKSNSSDEFLVEKKDPLVLPPDFEKLPTPDERKVALDEISIFEKTLSSESSTEDSSSTGSSSEEAILEKIRKN